MTEQPPAHLPADVAAVWWKVGRMDHVVRFTRPTSLLSLNDRRHWRAQARVVKVWREAAAWYGREQLGRLQLGPSVVTLTIPVRDRRRRDPSNWAPTLKACVDGLTDIGLWPDDDSRWVATVEPVIEFRHPTECHKITLTITPR